MYTTTGNKKMLNMLILDILKEYSDYNHRLTQQEIIRLLRLKYGIECDRRSVRNNIDYLTDLGYEIDYNKGYYLINREFDDAELRMLIDSVLFSKNMTQAQAKALIDKLKGQSNKYFSAKVTHICNLPELHYGDNKQLIYAIDTINDAISEKKKIRFVYNSYGTDFKLHPRKKEKYVVNPYQMVANNGKYYLIGNYDSYEDISHYRLDKMTDVEKLEEKIKPEKEVNDSRNGFSLPKHMAEHIYMFSGESISVIFVAPEKMMDELVDWFGKNFCVRKMDQRGMIEIRVRCNEEAMFYWALQYGPFVEVIQPTSLRKRVTDAVKEMNKKYE